MTAHPETYTLTREEWLTVNRALAGASLGLLGWKGDTPERKDRRAMVQAAQEILSASYDRASQRNTA